MTAAFDSEETCDNCEFSDSKLEMCSECKIMVCGHCSSYEHRTDELICILCRMEKKDESK